MSENKTKGGGKMPNKNRTRKNRRKNLRSFAAKKAAAKKARAPQEQSSRRIFRVRTERCPTCGHYVSVIKDGAELYLEDHEYNSRRGKISCAGSYKPMQ